MIEALIFDMDGTIVDNMHYHDLAWQATLNYFGLDLPFDVVQKNAYGINREALTRFFGEPPTSDFAQEFSERKEALYRDLYREHMRPIDGLTPFLEAALAKDIPMAIATGSAWRNTNFILETLELRHYFKTIVTAEQVNHGKPHPEGFLEAAQRLQVAPEKCMVFEDVPNGAKAAYNAGMPCIFLTTSYPAFYAGSFTGVVQCLPNYLKLSLSEVLTSGF